MIDTLVGQRFGKLLVVEYVGLHNGLKGVRRLLCDCGEERFYQRTVLSRVRSCGCARGDAIAEARTSHGMRGHRAYRCWLDMIARCTNPKNHAYKNYGGRGITVCPEWLESFEAFWRDMGPTYDEKLTLDREENDDGYRKDNCRWVTRKMQTNNRRVSKLKGL